MRKAWSYVLGGVLALGSCALAAQAQRATAASDVREAIGGFESTVPHQFKGLPTDWADRFLVFSEPATGSGAAARVQSNPRYWLAKIRRSVQTNPARIELNTNSAGRFNLKRGKKSSLTGDWSMNLGPGGTVGAEMYPAKYTFDPIGPADCDKDFVVFNTSLAGSATQASIVAFNKLYKTTCGSTVPATYWAYNTGGTARTSVVLSSDGTQVAFVQSEGSVANLVLLKWKSGSGSVSSPVTLTAVSPGSYRTCSAPCMTHIAFSGNPDDTNSAPFPDYSGDVMYVGADNGTLHKFTGVFRGTPTKADSSWPVTVHSGTILSSPVYDAATSRVFVGDASGQAGYVTAAGVVGGTQQIGAANSVIVDAPLLDGSTGKLIWFSSISSNLFIFFFQLSDYVEQTDTALSSLRSLTFAAGVSLFTQYAGRSHAGAFDDSYMAAPNQGYLYFCAQQGGSSNYNNPSLYRVGFDGSGTMNSGTSNGPLALVSPSPTNGECSPVTEFVNGSQDRVFVGVTANGNRTGCTGACLYSFNIGPSWPTNATAGLAATGGTSGVIVDNASASTGASQVYFSPLGGGAVQASQSGLN